MQNVLDKFKYEDGVDDGRRADGCEKKFSALEARIAKDQTCVSDVLCCVGTCFS